MSRRPWIVLILLSIAQFMVILDVTVVNVALPNIKDDLGFSESGLAWVVNGYILMAGGLLLLGGRLADIFGRRRLFLLGVGVFAVASALCGAAVDPGVLVGARFLQGVGEALAAPASLGLIALLFPDPGERMKALGLWGGIAGLGGTSGTVDFSSDAKQSCMYIADLGNDVIYVVNRENLTELSRFGGGGRQAGQFHWPHVTAVDSAGHVYVGEVDGGAAQPPRAASQRGLVK